MKIFKITAIALLLAVSFSACEQDEIDMSNIDFSNIENLYAQPLPVIQKCVQGKWKWYVSIGGIAGKNYSDDTFIDINDDYYIITYHDGSQRSFNFKWRRYTARMTGYKTYAMWDKKSTDAGWYFHSIRNDTLSVGFDPPPGSADIPYRYGFVRIKQ